MPGRGNTVSVAGCTGYDGSRNSWVEYTVGGVRLGFVAPTSIPANSPAPDQANTLWIEFVSSVLTGPQGVRGSTGRATVLVYIRAATEPALPTDGDWDGTTLTLPSGYSATTPTGTDTLFALVAELDSSAQTFTPKIHFQAQGIRGRRGFAGADSTVPGPVGPAGTGFVVLYQRAATEPGLPSDGAWDGTTLTLPTGWTRTDPDPASTDNLYSLLSELDSENNTFTPITVYSAQGVQGPAGQSAPHVQIQYSDDNGTTWHPNPPAIVTHLRVSTDNGTTWNNFAIPRGPQGIQGIPGGDSTVPGPAGSGYAILYRRQATRPPLPTTGGWNGQTITLPTNWHLNDPNPSSTEPLWALLVELDSVNDEFYARIIFEEGGSGGGGGGGASFTLWTAGTATNEGDLHLFHVENTSQYAIVYNIADDDGNGNVPIYNTNFATIATGAMIDAQPGVEINNATGTIVFAPDGLQNFNAFRPDITYSDDRIFEVIDVGTHRRYSKVIAQDATIEHFSVDTGIGVTNNGAARSGILELQLRIYDTTRTLVETRVLASETRTWSQGFQVFAMSNVPSFQDVYLTNGQYFDVQYHLALGNTIVRDSNTRTHTLRVDAAGNASPITIELHNGDLVVVNPDSSTYRILDNEGNPLGNLQAYIDRRFHNKEITFIYQRSASVPTIDANTAGTLETDARSIDDYTPGTGWFIEIPTGTDDLWAVQVTLDYENETPTTRATAIHLPESATGAGIARIVPLYRKFDALVNVAGPDALGVYDLTADTWTTLPTDWVADPDELDTLTGFGAKTYAYIYSTGTISYSPLEYDIEEDPEDLNRIKFLQAKQMGSNPFTHDNFNWSVFIAPGFARSGLPDVRLVRLTYFSVAADGTRTAIPSSNAQQIVGSGRNGIINDEYIATVCQELRVANSNYAGVIDFDIEDLYLQNIGDNGRNTARLRTSGIVRFGKQYYDGAPVTFLRLSPHGYPCAFNYHDDNGTDPARFNDQVLGEQALLNPANSIYYAYGRVNDYGNSFNRAIGWGDGNVHDPGFDSRGDRILFSSTANEHTIDGFEGYEWRGWGGAALDGTDTYELFGNFQHWRSADGLSNFQRGSSGVRLEIREAEFCFGLYAAIPAGQSADVYGDYIGTPNQDLLMGDTFKAPVSNAAGQSDDLILVWARSNNAAGPNITAVSVGNNLESTSFSSPWSKGIPTGGQDLWLRIVELDYNAQIASTLNIQRFPDSYENSATIKIWEDGQENNVDTIVVFDGSLWETITYDDGSVNEDPSVSEKYSNISTEILKGKPTAHTGILADFALPIHRWDASDASFVVQSGQQDISHAYTLSDLNKRLTSNVPELVIHFPALTDSSPNNSIIRYNHTGSALDVLTGDTTIGLTFEEAGGTVLSRAIIYAGTGIQIPANSEAEIGMAGAAVSYTLMEGDSILIDIADSRNPETSDTFYYGNNFGFTVDLDVVNDEGHEVRINTTGIIRMIDGNNANAEGIYQKGVGARGLLLEQIEEGKIILYKEGIRLIAGQTIVFKAIFFETLHDIAAYDRVALLNPE